MKKIELRNLFNNVFGNNAKPTLQGSSIFELINKTYGTCNGYSGDVYDEATVRSCIHSIATHCAKLKPQHRKERTVIENRGFKCKIIASAPTTLPECAKQIWMDNMERIIIGHRSEFDEAPVPSDSKARFMAKVNERKRIRKNKQINK